MTHAPNTGLTPAPGTGPSPAPHEQAEFAGRCALVVGGYGGIGRAVSETFAACGAHVAVAGRSQDRAEELAAKLRDGGRQALGHQVDVTDRKDVARLVENVASALGGLDILVNCASALVTRSAESFTEQDWAKVVETNLSGAFWLSQAAFPVMTADGNEGGRIVHLSSVRGLAGARRGFSAYGASKAGLNLLVKQLATEWGRFGIAVNAVAPGFVRTEFVHDAGQDPEFMRMVVARTPLGRTAEVQEVADAVVYLASPRARFVTGQILYVDGGVSASQ